MSVLKKIYHTREQINALCLYSRQVTLCLLLQVGHIVSFQDRIGAESVKAICLLSNFCNRREKKITSPQKGAVNDKEIESKLLCRQEM